MTTRVRNFQREETVPIWAEIKTWAGIESSPDQGVEIVITDPNGVIKAGDIAVLDSTDFAVGLVVTGGTSGATGLIVAKPNATRLRLQQISGTWQLDETITDTGIGESTTTSALTASDMAEVEEGKFVYHYLTTTSSVVGWWKIMCKAQDGLLADAKYTVAHGGFFLE